MKWLSSNVFVLLAGAVISMLLFGYSFIRIRLELAKPNWILAAIATVLLLLTAVGGVSLILGPPGGIPTVPEPDGPLPQVPATALERLRLDWNSEDVARWPAAETLAQMSDLAYQPPYLASRRFRDLGFPKVMTIAHASMLGYVVSGEDVTVITFRGTNFKELSDWIRNADAVATADTPHGKVHRGFHEALVSLQPQVNEILKDCDTTHLWVTGHSLGGALALLCAYQLEQDAPMSVSGVITYGQPMVARRDFADYIDTELRGRFARFVNRDDIVPRLPPQHVACGSLVWFTEDGIKRSPPKPSPRVDRDRIAITAQPSSSPKKVPAPFAEISPFTEGEFKSLQARLGKLGSTERVDPVPRPEGPDGPAMMKSEKSSLIENHSMDFYLREIRALLGITQEPTTQEPTG